MDNTRFDWLFFSIHNSTPEIVTVTTIKNSRCQPDAPARKLNAAPVLCANTRLNQEKMVFDSPYWKFTVMACLVI